MLSTVQETSPIVAVVGRCAVLEYSDHSTSNITFTLLYLSKIVYFFFLVRPTEIIESDVFICESVYDEHKKQIRRNLQGLGLRKFTHSKLVTPDEIYHFKRVIAPVKVTTIIYYYA